MTNPSWLDIAIGRLVRSLGSPLTRRSALNFGTGFTVTDDPLNDQTTITNSGGGGGGSGALVVSTVSAAKALTRAQLTDGQTVTVKSTNKDYIWSATTGAGVVGDDNTTLQLTEGVTGDAGRLYSKDGAPIVATIAALRAASAGVHNSVNVQAYATLGDNGAAIYDYDPTDTTSPDNGGTVIVAGTRRYKARENQVADVRKWGVVPNSTAAAAANRTAILAAVASGARFIKFPFIGTVWIDDTITFTEISGVRFEGHRHVAGDESNTPPGTTIRSATGFTSGGAVFKFVGCRSIHLAHLSFNGADQGGSTKKFLAGKGVEFLVTDVGQTSFDNHVEFCEFKYIFNPKDIRGRHKNSNLVYAGPTPPTITGIDTPVALQAFQLRVEMTDATHFIVSHDGGKTWAIDDSTTTYDKGSATVFAVGSSVSIPQPTYSSGLTLVLHWSAGTYTTNYFYESLCFGSVIHSDTYRQNDTTTFRKCQYKDVGGVHYQAASQAVAMKHEDCNASYIFQGIVIESGTFQFRDGQLAGQSNAQAGIEIRRGAQQVEILGTYWEFFGGHGVYGPSCDRTDRTIIRPLVMHGGFNSAVGDHPNDAADHIRMNQQSTVEFGGTYDHLNNTAYRLWFEGPNSNVIVVRADETIVWGASSTLHCHADNIDYRGPDRQGQAEGRGDFTGMMRWRNSGVGVGPMAGANAATEGDNLAASCIHQDDVNDRIVITTADKYRGLELTASADLSDRELAIIAMVASGGLRQHKALFVDEDDSAGAGYARVKIANPFNPATSVASSFGSFRSTTGVTVASGHADVWADQSGLSHDVSAAGSTNRPTYSASDAAWNNKPSLLWDGSDDGLQSASFTPVSQPVSGIIVGQCTDVAALRRLLSGLTGVVSQLYFDTDRTIGLYAGVSMVSAAFPVGDLGKPFLLKWRLKSGSQAQIEYLGFNGYIVQTGDAGTDVFNGFSIGCHLDGTSPFKGYIQACEAYTQDIGLMSSPGTDANKLATYYNGLYNMGLTV